MSIENLGSTYIIKWSDNNSEFYPINTVDNQSIIELKLDKDNSSLLIGSFSEGLDLIKHSNIIIDLLNRNLEVCRHLVLSDCISKILDNRLYYKRYKVIFNDIIDENR